MKKYQKFIDKNKIKLFGFIPARMAASRFPGKPLKLIRHLPMLLHVYLRSNFFKNWKDLRVATCDKEIINYCKKNNIPSIITSKKHRGCLDRVFEAALKSKIKIEEGPVAVEQKIEESESKAAVQVSEQTQHVKKKPKKLSRKLKLKLVEKTR